MSSKKENTNAMRLDDYVYIFFGTTLLGEDEGPVSEYQAVVERWLVPKTEGELKRESSFEVI